ncbi:GNAT family N-acetyltransferase [Roseobacter sp. EG26]|uniref:GNAT family N-acetyltransferase n=1 Tax=Roseobacter sp. EG26 TaxID=3412477 RepID=UPI003CE5780C
MIQPNLHRKDGIKLSLRLAVPKDAAYIHALRVDPRYNTHLSVVAGTVADQHAWLERYKNREAAGLEYYYLIERCADATPCGLVRLYDITAEQFTWGSWILDQNKPAKAALESAVLVYKIGFDCLGLRVSKFDVRKDNERTLAFHRRFGAVETGHDDQDVFFEYTRARFNRDLAVHTSAIAEAG